MRSILRCVLKTIFLKTIFRLLFRIRTSGFDKQINTGKLIVIANHESFMDGLLLALYLPFDPVFVVHTGVLRSWFFRQLLSQVDYLAVDATSPMAIKKVITLVESGRPVVIFPEGRLTVTGSMMKIYEGPAFVAAKTGATILPVRLNGPGRSYFSRVPGKYSRRIFPRITITAMDTTTIAMPQGETARLRRRKSGDAMRRLMQKMMFESQPQQTLYSGFLDVMAIYGRSRRVLEDVKQIEYSYGDLLKMTLALGRIVARHSKVKECVGILMPNIAETVCVMIGAGAQGRVPAMLNYKAGSGGMQDACAAAQIRTIIASRAFIVQAKLEADVAAIKDVNILYLEDLLPAMSVGDKLWVVFGRMFPRLMERRSNPAAAAVVLFTSGSEGKPKGVVLSHYALLSNIAQIGAIIDFSAEDKVLNAMPIFHSFGLTGGALLPLLSGMSLFLYPSPLHYRAIPELAYDRNCSVLFGTSTFLGNYAKFANPYDFFHLRYVIAGAEKLSEEVRKLWVEKFGIRILEGYGATETAPVLAVNTPMAYRSGTVGQLLPCIEFHLNHVPGIDEGGMLHVRGPNVMSGYYLCDAPGQLQPPSSEVGAGWYETGDVVSIDDDGFVSVIGRVKRFAKVAGEMVSLEVVEKIAKQISPGAKHGATTQPDSARGEAIVLFTTDAALTRESLVAAAQKLGIAEIAIPGKIQRVDSLPLLGTGKTDYVTLKQLAEKV
jgi:acyl-[acyl-carrier-protein]-phospholipid O-acyltransferase/long-chain-fatty-acid--[acyl-carrier-protein] ligase